MYIYTTEWRGKGAKRRNTHTKKKRGVCGCGQVGKKKKTNNLKIKSDFLVFRGWESEEGWELHLR